jgi:branched-subunit amino acid aminotransferase/4-amino-4-deoxychorismate lyase
MASMTIRGNCTLSEWVCAARENKGLEGVQRHHVLDAAKRRGVPVKEGRIESKHAGAIYFGLMEVMGYR